jgi:putative phosphoesterase
VTAYCLLLTVYYVEKGRHGMKIGILSDSHDHLENIRKCMAIFREKEVAFVMHLGDFVNPNSVRAMKGPKLIAVFGNNDGDRFRLMHAFHEIDGQIKGDFHDFEVDNIRFAAYHGTEYQITDALITSKNYDVVMYGHTHECVAVQSGDTLVLNPGTSHGFGGRSTIIIFDTQSRSAEIISA